jgi:hypothetical protein
MKTGQTIFTPPHRKNGALNSAGMLKKMPAREGEIAAVANSVG